MDRNPSFHTKKPDVFRSDDKNRFSDAFFSFFKNASLNLTKGSNEINIKTVRLYSFYQIILYKCAFFSNFVYNVARTVFCSDAVTVVTHFFRNFCFFGIKG